MQVRHPLPVVGPLSGAAESSPAAAEGRPTGPALAAHQAAKQGQGDRLLPAVRAAIERQAQALREHREAEEAFGDGQAALEELRARAGRQTSADHTRARALQRLAAERAGRVTAAPAVRRTA